MKKTIITIVSVVLLCACLVGTTFAWLVDKTETITNTFTFGNIAITLTETEGVGTEFNKSFKIVPGATINKDPKVAVTAGSEACWLFVQIIESNNTFGNNGEKFVKYEVSNDWTGLGNGIYYIKVDVSNSDINAEYYILKDNVVTVNSNATAKDFKDAGNNFPSITFVAYAVQVVGFENAADAWTQAQTLN